MRTLLGNTTKRLTVFVWVFATAATAGAGDAWIPAPPEPVAARDFPIMAWGASPSDAGQLRWMKEAGLNVSGFCRVEDLDLEAAAGLSCIVDDKRAGSREWDKLPDDAAVRKEIEELAAEIRGKPQVLGVYLQDEPSAAAMSGIGRVAAMVRERLPGTLAYVNLFPTYATDEQLGTKVMKPTSERFWTPFTLSSSVGITTP